MAKNELALFKRYLSIRVAFLRMLQVINLELLTVFELLAFFAYLLASSARFEIVGHFLLKHYLVFLKNVLKFY